MIKANKNSGLIAWLAITVFYFYQYIVRAAPSSMFGDITEQFGINADKFATLGSLYLIGYAIMQIPVGIMMDKFGVRKVVLISILICVVGTFISAISDSFVIIQIARFIEGVGSACALTSGLKVISDNFQEGKRAIFFGSTVSIGVLGAVISSNIIALVIDKYHPKDVWYTLTVVGVVIFIVSFILIKPNEKQSVSIEAKDVFKLCISRKILIPSIIAIGLYVPVAVLGDLWGIHFLQTKFNVTKSIAARINALLYIGMIFGSAVVPYIFERLGRIAFGIRISILIITILFGVLIYTNLIYPSVLLYIIIILLGFFCGGEMLCFTFALSSSNVRTSGVISGVVNTLNMAGSGILQQIIGITLDFVWAGSLNLHGNRSYSEGNFVFALTSMILVMVICLIFSLFMKDANNKH
ncbi:MFS transporter N-terminal domain protein [Candidatus Cyrtobacter comes]|uniref:Lysosomal dipeptide transporter MFSD1 n=1 Tax=Candidatus Cyrtobacter comes TaxID=675776 RepID=A0ABU5L874_9RICK|nr:MFS transporter [Candidatus Cyrtobacter comes]MDZ5762313.1 MFS transporter N-terminal domain protein [Candidatus Cyrtobacter comes]